MNLRINDKGSRNLESKIFHDELFERGEIQSKRTIRPRLENVEDRWLYSDIENLSFVIVSPVFEGIIRQAQLP